MTIFGYFGCLSVLSAHPAAGDLERTDRYGGSGEFLYTGYGVLVHWLWGTCTLAMGYLYTGYGVLVHWLWGTCTLAMGYLYTGYGVLVHWLWGTCTLAMGYLYTGYGVLVQ